MSKKEILKKAVISDEMVKAVSVSIANNRELFEYRLVEWANELNGFYWPFQFGAPPYGVDPQAAVAGAHAVVSHLVRAFGLTAKQSTHWWISQGIQTGIEVTLKNGRKIIGPLASWNPKAGEFKVFGNSDVIQLDDVESGSFSEPSFIPRGAYEPGYEAQGEPVQGDLLEKALAEGWSPAGAADQAAAKS